MHYLSIDIWLSNLCFPSNNIEMTENEHMIRNIAYDLVDFFDFERLVTESYHIYILITPKL